MNNKPVIICIGSDKVCGDMLGPLTGTILLKDYNINAYVYGTLSRPINGLNISQYMSLLSNIHKDSVIISVDASVGNICDIGKVKVKCEGVDAGAALGLNKRVNSIGIVGVVAASVGDVLYNLMSVKYDKVELLSKKIAHIIHKSINQVDMN